MRISDWKKVIGIGVILTLLLMCYQPAMAVSKFEKGVRAGLSISKFTGGDDAEFDNRTGFLAGFLGRYYFSEYMGVQSELNFVQKGSSIVNIGDKNTIKVDYFEIAVLMSVRIQNNQNPVPSFFAGPYLGFNLKSSSKYESGIEVEEVDVDNTNKTDFGLIIGAATDIPVGKYNIVIDARFCPGFSKVYKEPEDSDEHVLLMADDSAPDFKNTSFAVSIGFVF